MSAVLDMHNIPGFGDVRTWGGRHHEQGHEPDGVGDPAQEIRDGFAASGSVPYVNHTKKREMSMPSAEAFADALGSNDAWKDDMWRAACGDQLAAFRLRRAAVEWWIREQEDDLRECRRGALFADPENRIPSEAC